MYWIVLIIAGIFETCWAVGLKYSDGLKNTGWTVFTAVTLIISMGLLAYCLRVLPLGTAYAVWTGIGAVGTAILGIWLFGESANILRIGCMVLIVLGIAGLRLLQK